MPEDEVEAGTTTLRSRAIRQAVLRRNPFFTCTRIEIRNRNLGRSLGDRIAESHEFQAATAVAGASLAVIAQVIGAAVGLLVGLAVALLLVVILLGMVGLLLSTESSTGAGTFLLNQSWSHYVGWTLCCVVAFFCPYLLLGIPIDLSLRFFWPIHDLFAAKKARSSLRSHHDNNDPAARVVDDVTSHRLNMKDSPFFRLLKIIWWVISRIIVLICGILTLACFVVLYLKLGVMCLEQGAVLLIIIGGLMLYGLCFPYVFLRSRMGAGAMDELISSLFQGEPFPIALGLALASIEWEWIR